MAWYWIVLIVLAALLLLLCLTRVGALATIEPDSFQLDAKIGPIAIRILPTKKKAPKQKRQKQKPAATEKKAQGVAASETAEKPTAKKSKKPLPKPTLEDIKDAVATLWPPLKRALRRTRRGIRIKPLKLSVTVGAERDPASGAELYGYLHCGIWTAMPMLEKLLVIPDPHIHVGIDFDTPNTAVEGTVGISIRIGTLLMVAIGVGIPALRWFLRFQKKQKQSEKTPQSGQEPASPAA